MMLALTAQAQQKIYTLADWNLKDWDATKGELALNVSEYKLDFNHPRSSYNTGTNETIKLFEHLNENTFPLHLLFSQCHWGRCSNGL